MGLVPEPGTLLPMAGGLAARFVRRAGCAPPTSGFPGPGHCLVLDGVYRSGRDRLSTAAIGELLRAAQAKVLGRLRRICRACPAPPVSDHTTTGRSE